MLRLVLLAALLLGGALAWPVQAEQLYRCVGPKAAVSYQSLPCAPTARLDRVVEYRPEPVANTERPPARPPSTRRASRRGLRTATAGHTPHTTAAAHCRTTRAQRDAALERLGLKRTYAQLSRLDASVRAACD